jgi:hypothetical protein
MPGKKTLEKLSSLIGSGSVKGILPIPGKNTPEMWETPIRLMVVETLFVRDQVSSSRRLLASILEPVWFGSYFGTINFGIHLVGIQKVAHLTCQNFGKKIIANILACPSFGKVNFGIKQCEILIERLLITLKC